MKTSRIMLSMFCALLFAGAARADSILYFRDYVVGTDYMTTALNSRVSMGDTVYTAVSAADFQTQLQGGGYDLGIFFNQNWSRDTSAINARGSFVTGGGKAIYTDWTQNGSLAAQFGASFTGNTNQSPITVTDAALGIGVSGPINLSNPGWGVFSTALAGSQIAATFPNLEGAVVIGNSGRSIVNGFLSDTFAPGSVADGVQLYKNEIGLLLDGTREVPAPSSIVALLGLGASFVGLRWRKNR